MCRGLDNDGRLDLFMANYGKLGLFLQRAKGRFDDVSGVGRGIDGRYDTCIVGDIDNDGLLDVYVNGTVTGGISYRDYLLRNSGGKLEDVTPPNILGLQAPHGAQWADFDRDGDPTCGRGFSSGRDPLCPAQHAARSRCATLALLFAWLTEKGGRRAPGRS